MDVRRRGLVAEETADFRFTRVMAEQAARARLTLDDDQLSLIARLDALGQQLLSASGTPQGLYVWGRTGRGKVLSSTTFLPACRSPPGGGSIFITSSANCTSG
jgi:predicted ATPase